MKQPKDIYLGKAWTVKFQDAENPVFIEFWKAGETYGASLGFFEEHHMTSINEHFAPKSVIDAFEANEEIIYAWEQDYYDRNPRD
mgnify:CR=1 FL=1